VRRSNTEVKAVFSIFGLYISELESYILLKYVQCDFSLSRYAARNEVDKLIQSFLSPFPLHLRLSPAAITCFIWQGSVPELPLLAAWVAGLPTDESVEDDSIASNLASLAM